MDFTEFKNRNKSKNFEDKQKAMNDINKSSGDYGKKDERFWSVTPDKIGNSYSVIRPLPVTLQNLSSFFP
jgi:hypothetical protein